jgi:mono/diheme cytochrome c family protein
MNYNLRLLSSCILTLSFFSIFHAASVQSNGNEKQDVIVDPTKGDPAKGAAAWAENCGRCHNHRAPQEFSPDQWQPIMLHMRIQAGITGQAARDILAYLSGQVEPTAEVSNPEVTKAAVVSPVTDRHPKKLIHNAVNQKDMQPKAIKAAFQDHPAAQAATITPAAEKSGEIDAESLFNKDCAVCHGKDGKGAVSGDFTLPNSPIKTTSDEELLNNVKNGHMAGGRVMPPKGGHAELTDDQIKALITYMKKTFK